MGSSASLDRSPKANWVEKSGGLPPYVREVARSIHEKRGVALNTAIGFAISTMKRWAAGGGDVTAQTRAKAAKAVAQWEAAKAKNKARSVATSSQWDHVLELAARIDTHALAPDRQTALEFAVPVPPQFKQQQKAAKGGPSGSSSSGGSSGGPPAFVKAKPAAVSSLADLRKAVAAVARLPAEKQGPAKASLLQKARGIQGGMAVIPSSWSSSSSSSGGSSS